MYVSVVPGPNVDGAAIYIFRPYTVVHNALNNTEVFVTTNRFLFS